MKKLLSLILAIILVAVSLLAFTSCGGKKTNEEMETDKITHQNFSGFKNINT